MLTSIGTLPRLHQLKLDPVVDVPLKHAIHIVTSPPNVHSVGVAPLPVLVLDGRLERRVGVALDRLADVIHAVFHVVPGLLLRFWLFEGVVVVVLVVSVGRVYLVLVLVAEVPPGFAEEDLMLGVRSCDQASKGLRGEGRGGLARQWNWWL